MEAAWTFGNHWAFQTKSHWIHLSHLWCLKVREECVCCVQFLVKGDLLQFFPLFFSSSNSPARPRHLLTVHTKQYYTDHWACFWFYWLLLLKTRNLPVNDPLKLLFCKKLRHFFSGKGVSVHISILFHFSNHRRQTKICLWVIFVSYSFFHWIDLVSVLLPSGLKAGLIKRGDESCFERIWEKLWGGTLRHYYDDKGHSETGIIYICLVWTIYAHQKTQCCPCLLKEK